MAKQIIRVGTGPNTGTADSIRVAFEKVNANFTELYSELSSVELGEVTWTSITGKPTFAAVATSGNYDDLTNKPVIVTDLSQLTDNQGLLADSFDGGGAASEYNEEQTIDGGQA
jgi:hypothetical protein